MDTADRAQQADGRYDAKVERGKRLMDANRQAEIRQRVRMDLDDLLAELRRQAIARRADQA